MTSPTSLAPKPFVFVLMPFDKSFKDIYKFGIRGAADDVGAYAERLDDQLFVEGMLDRIFNQISKADVIVADMTGRNPNVFYEVGYAHALGKLVVLLTQDVNDIPFDFKHRQHIVYGGEIDLLRSELAVKLQWAISEAKKGRAGSRVERFSLRLMETELHEGEDLAEAPTIKGQATSRDFILPLHIRNDGFETISAISHVYLFAEPKAAIVPVERTPPGITYDVGRIFRSSGLMTVDSGPKPLEPIKASSVDSRDGLSSQYRLKLGFPSLPPGAVEVASLHMMFREGLVSGDGTYRLRLHTASQYYDFLFKLALTFGSPTGASNSVEGEATAASSKTETQPRERKPASKSRAAS